MKRTIFYFVITLCLNNQMLFSQDRDSPKYLDQISFEQLYNASSYKIIYSGDIAYLKYLIDPFSIARFDLMQLAILRNTIYAQYGYDFKSNDLKQYFMQYKWYTINSKYSDSLLTDTDRANLQIIKSYENALTSNISIDISKQDIIGVWQQGPIMAAGWNERFEFHNDGTLNWYSNQMFGAKRLLSYSGKWSINHNLLIFDINKIKYIKDGTISKESQAINGYTIENGIISEFNMTNAIQYKFPIEKPAIWKRDELERWSIKIANEIWFRMEENPENYN